MELLELNIQFIQTAMNKRNGREILNPVFIDLFNWPKSNQLESASRVAKNSTIPIFSDETPHSIIIYFVVVTLHLI